MASHAEDDVMPEETQGYKLSQPKQSLAEYQQMGMLMLTLLSPRPEDAPDFHLTFGFTRNPDQNHFPHLITMRILQKMEDGRIVEVTPCPPPPTPVTIAKSEADEKPGKDKAKRGSVASGSTASSCKRRASEEMIDCLRFLGVPIPGWLIKLGITSANRAGPVCADANDESLQRYKESLGLSGGKDLSDPSDPRVCIIKSLTMDTPGRDPVTIDLSTPGSEKTLKEHPFKIKEGSKFTMSATFKVQHEILSGLHYVQVVKRKGIKVSKDSEMIGSYAPNTDKQPLYTKKFQEEEAPSGMLARGHYNAISSFVDDDKKTHLQFEWSFDIAKDW
ncbi:Rho GDP dissociation inhibitor [Pleurostoma richardsiae]|uniref:Rho GDP-dissociation inhibitor n=1 Tax=Pleurostoma richardsiae TaxID=41990 RepID=A0AA38R8G1_9PEZI|nr:Rho GDP dissociation inhibitor [Pleurostoma richardsiae]